MQYSSHENLVRALKSCDWKGWFLECRKHNWCVERVVHVSVGPNTFRFFRHLPEPPSAVFRQWAIRAVSERFIEQLNACDNQASFDKILRGMTGSLQRTWMRKMGKPLQVGPAIKLPSLLLKHLCASTIAPVRRLHPATQFLHTPLDSYTLAAIRQIHNGCHANRNCTIPNGAGMGWVSSWPQYRAVHKTIQDCVAQAKVPAIALDVLAWNQTHVE